MRHVVALIGALSLCVFGTHPATALPAATPTVQGSHGLGPVPKKSPPPTRKLTPEDVGIEAWRTKLTHTSHAKGCFKAVYPDPAWLMIPCVSATEDKSHSISKVEAPLIVGGGTAYVATVSGLMTNAIGSFGNVGNLLTESIKETAANDTYSVQINANNFNVTNLVDSTGTKFCTTTCTGWEQFLYETSAGTNSGSAYIEYWLFIGPQCPNGWSFIKAPTSTSRSGCKFDTTKVPTPHFAITDLGELALQGYVDPQGNDNVIVSHGKAAYASSLTGSLLSLASNWNQSEFNVFADLNARTALFNPGAIISVKLKVDGQPGGLGAINCQTNGGTTAETTNLTLEPGCYSGFMEGWSQIDFGESTPPVITSISPTSGPEGGTKIDVTGAGFFVTNPQNSSVDNGTEIAFDSQYVGATCDTTTHCVVIAPSVDSAILANVTAVDYTSTDLSLASAPPPSVTFQYKALPQGFLEPNHGLPGGGTNVTFFGKNIVNTPGGTTFVFQFGSQNVRALNVSCFNALTSGQECTMTTPALTTSGPGPTVVPVVVTADKLTNTIGSFAYYTPAPPPPPPPPPPICHCGSGQKCCPDPDGGRLARCVAAAARCPPLQ